MVAGYRRRMKMELQQLLVRVRPEVIAGLDLYKDKTRMTKAATVEMALRDFLAKHDIVVEQPQTE
jgi:hypothetical protein